MKKIAFGNSLMLFGLFLIVPDSKPFLVSIGILCAIAGFIMAITGLASDK